MKNQGLSAAIKTRGIMYKRIFVIVLLTVALYFSLSAVKGAEHHKLETDRLPEASGLAHSLIHEDILYSHNDSGGEASVFALDTKGNLLAEIQLSGVRNRDWEDIATGIDPKDGKEYIYIGEIGDNSARYPSVWVHRIPEPDFTDADSLITASGVTSFEIVYEDGARDAEALFIEPDSGDIYILSKREERVGIYRVSYPQSSTEINTAERLGDMNMGWVTAADISSNGRYILVKNYMGIRRYKKGKRRSVLKALQGKGKSLPYQLEPQGEAVCFDARGKGYYTLSEASGESPQILYYYK